ncbi:MAG: type IV secretory system conjugative DNA transfer family protein [Treponema sp.]|nr:type IV secretory system conjugative DNA transfer family protein [Treponema sp.]
MSDNEFLRGKPRDAKDEQLFNLLMKAVTLTAIFFGIWAGTQRFCNLVAYDPGWVGYPFHVIKFGKKFAYPLYNPFLIFYWTLMYFKKNNIHSTLYTAYKIIGYTSISAIVFYFLIEFVLMKYIAQNIFGTARWGNKKDLIKAGLLQNKGGMVLGQLADAKVYSSYDRTKDSVILHLQKPSQKIIQSGIYNTLLSAPTRSGKGVSSVMTTLLCYPGSVIVLDFKGESFNYTSSFRKIFGKVYRWDPTGDKGHHFNPMMEIRSGENAFSDANLIADILTTPASGGGNATSEHFQTGAKDFLTAVILHCLCSDWKDKSLPGCRKFLAQGDPTDPNNNKYIYDLMINSDHGDEMIHQAVVEGAMAQRNRPQDEGGSMLSTVNNALAVFADPKIARNTWNSEFYIDEFEETKVPVSLYLTIQYNDVQRISPLIRLFITFFSRKFTGGETSAGNRKFKVPLLFILDEFDKLGRMDELEMNMGIHNGFGIHYFLIFQSLNQLNKIYTKDHSFLAHARNTIIYAPGTGEVETAELISKICGKESISRTNISYSGGKAQVGYSNKSISAQDQERNLINADEVMKMPQDHLILLCQGLPPYMGKKNVYYEDPAFEPRIIKDAKGNPVPAFTTREEALKAAASTVKKLNKRRWFDKGDTYRSVDMSADEIADMWDKVAGLYDEPDDAPASVPEDNFEDNSDNSNFLK